MATRDWRLSINRASFSDAKQDAARFGEEMIAVPALPVSRNADGSIARLDADDSMEVLLDELLEFMELAGPTVRSAWLGEAQSAAAASEMGLEPDDRIYVDIMDDEAKLKVGKDSTLMRYVISRIAD